ncbi:MAG TPA: hypothetical protein VMM13_17510, partial [Euzebya sp.]|nr:hypothetical protein [Euzebya sp.]
GAPAGGAGLAGVVPPPPPPPEPPVLEPPEPEPADPADPELPEPELPDPELPGVPAAGVVAAPDVADGVVGAVEPPGEAGAPLADTPPPVVPSAMAAPTPSTPDVEGSANCASAAMSVRGAKPIAAWPSGFSPQAAASIARTAMAASRRILRVVGVADIGGDAPGWRGFTAGTTNVPDQT